MLSDKLPEEWKELPARERDKGSELASPDMQPSDSHRESTTHLDHSDVVVNHQVNCLIWTYYSGLLTGKHGPSIVDANSRRSP